MYITFRCDKLEGYEEGYKNAEFDVQAYLDAIPEADMESRMLVVLIHPQNTVPQNLCD